MVQIPAPKLLVPAWVPEPVAQLACKIENIIATMRNPKMASVLRKYLTRLVTDERMEGVWYELSRQRRDGAYLYPAIMPGDDAEVRQQAAMASLLDHAVSYAIAPGRTVTVGQALQRFNDFFAKADVLQNDAGVGHLLDAITFGGKRDIMTKERREKLRAAANTYLDIAMETFEADMKVALVRDVGDHIERWLARALTETCRNLFGQPMYGQVAKIVTVIRDREITMDMVRHWVCG